MALQSFTLTVGALSDADNNDKNYVSGQAIYIKKPNGTLASIYRDLSGTSQINQDGFSNVTNSKGQFTFFVDAGDYIAEYGGQSTPITVVGSDYFNSRIDESVEQITSELSELRGFRVKGSFASGFTYELPNDVGVDASGNHWIYTDVNALPFIVPAATTPSAPTYTQVTFNQASSINVATGGNVEDRLNNIKVDNGSSVSPSISFISDTNTGIYLKDTDALAFSTGGVERLTVQQSGFIGIGTDNPTAKLHVEVDNEVSAGIRSQCTWTGSTGNNYQNNDVIFTDTRNEVLSDSENYSWGISSSNAFNKIPEGVTDSGYRIGAYGWAVSVNAYGFEHAGTLALQVGVRGRAGYQGGGSLESPAGSVVQTAIGVQGQIQSDSANAKIQNAYSGQFNAYGYAPNTVDNNYAVYADARNGTLSNWSFYGNEGKMFQKRQALFSSDVVEIDNPAISARKVSNCIEFGYPQTGGLGGALGCTFSAGWPALTLGCEVGATGNKFTTRGKSGHVIYNDLEGKMVHAVVPDVNTAEQDAVAAFTVDSTATVEFTNRPIFPSNPPITSTSVGKTGSFAWDGSYFYICTSTNNWLRAPLQAW